MPRALIILVIAIVAILSNSKKKKKSRTAGRQTLPGRQPRPWPEAQPPGAAEVPVQATQLEPSAWEAREKGFGQGESRECEHGVVGGSIPGDIHEGEEKHAVRRAPEARPVKQEPLRPRMDARELRRAVVMSEILKRPSERRRRT